ncbi:Carboxypeptidase G2 precursor [Rosistilla carotiformis]|uniref:Carboxypeptidase G2 n=1 Tax=Rosistilla carotiformis TaxID=2528017 RepID=A0A518JX81_9BACT|nr:hydrolase [Rosistilla carotiformis]QDV70148.1 Carboxypeptidase G2 precursor [Rosistilla carotiformis]
METPSDRLHAACLWLESEQAAITDQLIQWAEIASGSHDTRGLQRMADRLRSDWQQHGLTLQPTPVTEIQEIDAYGELVSWKTVDALVASRRPDASRRVLLAIHFDTVYEADSVFKQCRWLDSHRLGGPGVVDAKGGLLVMMWALAAIERFQLAEEIGWTAVLNPDEEIGSPASAGLFQQLAVAHDFGLLFEPCLPDGAMVSDRKGSGNFTVIVRGRSAHAGRDPESGRNAIVLLAKLIGEIDRLNDFQLGTTVNVGRIEGGGPLNRVPDLAIGRLNVRVDDRAAQSQFESQLRRIVERANSNEGFSVALHGGFHAPPKIVDASTWAIQRAVEASIATTDPAIRWQPTGGACDGSKLAFYGLPNVDTLGPRGGNLHSPEEWVDTATLVPKATSIVRLLTAYARGGESIG